MAMLSTEPPARSTPLVFVAPPLCRSPFSDGRGLSAEASRRLSDGGWVKIIVGVFKGVPRQVG